MRCYRAYGGPKPPPINHQGIDDTFYWASVRRAVLPQREMAEADGSGREGTTPSQLTPQRWLAQNSIWTAQ